MFFSFIILVVLVSFGMIFPNKEENIIIGSNSNREVFKVCEINCFSHLVGTFEVLLFINRLLVLE